MNEQEAAKLVMGLVFFVACMWVLLFRPDPKFDEYARMVRESKAAAKKEEGHE